MLGYLIQNANENINDLTKVAEKTCMPIINIGMNNLERLMSRLEHAKLIAIKILKEAKNKKMHANLAQSNDCNDDGDGCDKRPRI